MDIQRIYALHEILRSRATAVCTGDLMETLRCSRSTLHRTIKHLKDDLGAPISNAPGRGYFYDRSKGVFELPGLWFGSDELAALLVMDHLVAHIQPGLLQGHIEPLRNRLRELLSAGTRKGEPFPTHRIRILRAHGRTLSNAQFIPVATAVVERRRLSFRYEARTTGVPTQREVSPQRLVYYRDQWYADGWDEAKDALRTFALDRMQDVDVLDEPARDVPDAQLDAALTPGYGVFAGDAPHQAQLLFSVDRARWVADEAWHPDQVGKFREDGRYELAVPYSDARELVGEILRHGPDVVVLGPPELAQEVWQRHQQAAGRYR